MLNIEPAQTMRLLQHCDLQSPQAQAMPLSSSLFAGGCAPSVTAHPSDSAIPPKQHPEIEITVRDVPMIGEVTVMGKYMDDAKMALQLRSTFAARISPTTPRRGPRRITPLVCCKPDEDFKCLSCRIVDVCHCVKLGLQVMAPRN